MLTVPMVGCGGGHVQVSAEDCADSVCPGEVEGVVEGVVVLDVLDEGSGVVSGGTVPPVNTNVTAAMENLHCRKVGTLQFRGRGTSLAGHNRGTSRESNRFHRAACIQCSQKLHIKVYR